MSEDEISELHQRLAKQMVDVVLRNGGLYIKLGQILSTLNHIVPLEWTEAFEVCQDKAPLLPLEDVRKLFLKEFGESMDDIFLEFDEVPFASASLSQVHLATLLNGDQVAVKVQYPNIRSQIREDLWAIGSITFLLRKTFKHFQLDWLLHEFKKNLQVEIGILKI